VLSLARLLDGLDVTFEPPLAVGAHREWSVCSGTTTAAARGTLRGGAVLELAGGACIRISRHSVTVTPSRPSARGASAGDPDVLVARGRIRVTYHGSVDLFEHLQEPLVEPLTADDPIRASLDALVDELTGQRPGSRAMAEALLKRCLILLLRRQSSRGPGRTSWSGPLEDARLGRAVTEMQAHPDHAFTLPALAEVAGMSRSVFAARFSEVLGRPPIEFLKSLRLELAARLLAGTDLPVKTIATRVGYSSRSSFTRAFIGRHGLGPAAFRATARRRAGQAMPVAA
jgi:AraC-like DNA-binding protein